MLGKGSYADAKRVNKKHTPVLSYTASRFPGPSGAACADPYVAETKEAEC